DGGPAHVGAAAAEIPVEDLVDQFGECAGDLDAGRAAAHDHEREGAVVDDRRVGVGGLEPSEDVVAQADRVGQDVQRETVLGDAGCAEVVDGRAGGDDEPVEGE